MVTLFLPNSAFIASQSEAFYQNGNACFDKDQYDLAIIYYTKAIALNPQYAKAYNNRGLAYRYKSRYELAIADYNAILRIDPGHTEALRAKKELLEVRVKVSSW